MYAETKESSKTTKVQAILDASTKTSIGVSLNDTLLVRPTVHSSLVDILLRLRFHHVAFIADMSHMYRATALTEADKDLHRLVRRNLLEDTLRDNRMTHATFGVSAFFIRSQHVRQTKCLRFCFGVPSCCQGSRGLVLRRRWPQWSRFKRRGNPIVPAVTESQLIRERWILTLEMEFKRS